MTPMLSFFGDRIRSFRCLATFWEWFMRREEELPNKLMILEKHEWLYSKQENDEA
jgi:hypothetical protein